MIFLGIVTAIGLVVGIYFLTRKSDWASKHATEVVPLPEKLPTKYLSERGVSVFSAVRPSDLQLRLIDEGIQITINNTAGKNWQKYRHHSEFEIILLPLTDYSKIGGCPLLRTTGMNSITIAGAVIGVRQKGSGVDAKRPMIAMPYSDVKSEYCQNLYRDTAKHEAEHIVLLNDLTQFFFYTGVNDIHPIFGKASLRENEFTKGACFTRHFVEWSQNK